MTAISTNTHRNDWDLYIFKWKTFKVSIQIKLDYCGTQLLNLRLPDVGSMCNALVEGLSSTLTRNCTLLSKCFGFARMLSCVQQSIIHLFRGQIKTCLYLMYLVVPEHTQSSNGTYRYSCSNTAWWCTAIEYHQNLFSYILPSKTFLSSAYLVTNSSPPIYKMKKSVAERYRDVWKITVIFKRYCKTE